MSIIPEDKVVWGRGVPGDRPNVAAAVVLAIIVAVLFLGLVMYGFNDAVTRERPPVTLLTPTTGG